MASRLFPDSGSRQVLRPNGDQAASGTITYYLDTVGTLAPVYADRGTGTPDPADAFAGSATHLDAYGRQINFRGPTDGTDVLYAKVDNGPLFQVYAAAEPRLRALEQANADLGEAAALDVGDSADTVAAGDAPAAAAAGAVTAAATDAAARYARREAARYLSPAGGVASALLRGQTATIQNVGDSTGNETTEWLALLGQTLGGTYDANVVWVPWNDTSQAYDPPTYLRTGAAGERYATFNAGNVTFPAASITGDLDVVAKLRPTAWASGAVQVFAAKYDPAGNQRGWQLSLSASGRPTLLWSADGTSTTITASATTGTPFSNGTWGWVRATLDVDNGAGGYTATFYTSTDGITWSALGTPVTAAGVTSIFNNTAVSYSAGSYGKSSPVTPFAGDIAWLEIRNGIGGPTVVPPLLGDWDQESSMGSNTVVFSGSPTLLLLAGSQSGQNISYFDNATRRPKLMAQYGQDVILLNDGHNEGNQAGPQWVSLYSTWVSNIRALHPSVPIVCLTQNPTKSPLTPNQTAVRARRGASLMTWARSQAGVYGVDTYPAFTDLAVQINADGLHPTKQGEVGAGLSGQEKWAAYLHQALFQ